MEVYFDNSATTRVLDKMCIRDRVQDSHEYEHFHKSRYIARNDIVVDHGL